MIREHLFHKRAPADPLFRWRGAEVSRLEAFSDAVFALTLTLLVVSVSVPETFHDLWLTVRDLPAFLASFLMLLMAWHYHYQYFRRYGLEDFATVLLNSAFLFLVLFFAYPLKFLATFLWRLVLGDDMGPMFATPDDALWNPTNIEQRQWMMYFYGLALIGVFGVLALMVGRALVKGKTLELDALEIHLTRMSLAHHLITVGVSLLSLGILWTGGSPGYAGVVYFLLGPLHGVCGWLGGKRTSVLHQELLGR